MLTLSNAIRLGAQESDQGYGNMIDEQGRTCAMGGALKVAGILSRLDVFGSALKKWPYLSRLALVPVETDGRRLMLMAVILGLNDKYRWTREQIADWVEAEETRWNV